VNKISNEKVFILTLITLFSFVKLLLFPEKGNVFVDKSLIDLDYTMTIYFVFLLFCINIFFLVFVNFISKQKLFLSNLIILLNIFIILNIYLFGNINIFKLYILINFLVAFLVFFFIIFLKSNILFSCMYLITNTIILLIYSIIIILNLQFSHRLDVIFKQPNHLGNILAFGILFLSFMILSLKNHFIRLFIWIIVFILSLGLVATLSRGAWLGLGVGFIVGVILSFIYIKNKIEIVKLILYLFVCIIISNIIVNPNRISERFNMSVKNTEISTVNRVTLWKTSIKMIKDHPYFGVGLGNFGDVLEENYKIRFLNGETFSSALNNYLTLAAEAGIPALILYLIIIGYAIYLSIKSIFSKSNIDYNLTSENKYLQGFYNFLYINDFTLVRIGLLAGIISMLVFGLTTYTLTRVYSNLLIWSSFGYIIASDIKNDKSEKEENI